MKPRLEIKQQVQLISLLVSSVLFYLLMVGKLNSAHEFCPYSSICFGPMSLNSAVGTFVYPITVGIGIVIAISSIFFGRVFCGYICPFGTIQEFLFKSNPKFKKKLRKNKIPIKLHLVLSVFKYLVLLFTGISSLLLTQYFYINFCPVYSLAHPRLISIASILSFLILFGLGYFSERFWCRYICPYGALMNIFQYIGKMLKIPSKRINIDKNSCIACKICSNCCPMGIDVEKDGIVDDPNCIHCLRCINKCPIDNCLTKK